MTTLNLNESHDFDSERYLLATEIADLMTKQFNETEIMEIFPYFQIGGGSTDEDNSTPDGNIIFYSGQ